VKAYGRRIVDRHRRPRTRRSTDNPAREYNRPEGAKLLDVPGLLVVLGLVVAGLLLALAVTHHVI
jgi:hypothetical protein